MNNNTNKCKWKHDLVARCASVIISTRSARALLSSFQRCCCSCQTESARALLISTHADRLFCALPSALISMATSDGSEDCVVQRGRSHSDPSILTDTRVVYTNSTGEWYIHASLPQTYLILPRRGIVRSSCRLSRKQNTNTGMTECLYPCIAHWC